jgi:hypothetical protein
MTGRPALFIGCVLPMLGALFGCGEGGSSRPRQVLKNAVAAVGDEVIDAATVTRVATAQNVDPRRALDQVVSDAVIAASAAERLGQDRVRQVRRGALARALLELLAEDVRQKGPPSDTEVAEATEKRWWELDRPPLLRTTHAVAMTKKPGDDVRARAVAARIAERVAGISDPAAFRMAATSVPSDGLEVRVEDLPPMRRDGIQVDADSPQAGPRGSTVREYVEAAFAIPAVGRTSPVIRTEYGYHVILAVSWTPEHRVPVEERRKMLADEIINGRALASMNAALAHAKSLEPVSVERSAVESMMLVRMGP